MDERSFQHHAEEAMEQLQRELYKLEESGGFEVEERGGAIHLNFEEPAGTFVISPNSSARQIWVSALLTSFKLDWSEEDGGFVLSRTGELLGPLMTRLIAEQCGG